MIFLASSKLDLDLDLDPDLESTAGRGQINYRHFEDDMNPRVFKKEGLKHLDRVIELVSRPSPSILLLKNKGIRPDADDTAEMPLPESLVTDADADVFISIVRETRDLHGHRLARLSRCSEH